MATDRFVDRVKEIVSPVPSYVGAEARGFGSFLYGLSMGILGVEAITHKIFVEMGMSEEDASYWMEHMTSAEEMSGGLGTSESNWRIGALWRAKEFENVKPFLIQNMIVSEMLGNMLTEQAVRVKNVKDEFGNKKRFSEPIFENVEIDGRVEVIPRIKARLGIRLKEKRNRKGELIEIESKAVKREWPIVIRVVRTGVDGSPTTFVDLKIEKELYVKLSSKGNNPQVDPQLFLKFDWNGLIDGGEIVGVTEGLVVSPERSMNEWFWEGESDEGNGEYLVPDIVVGRGTKEFSLAEQLRIDKRVLAVCELGDIEDGVFGVEIFHPTHLPYDGMDTLSAIEKAHKRLANLVEDVSQEEGAKYLLERGRLGVKILKLSTFLSKHDEFEGEFGARRFEIANRLETDFFPDEALTGGESPMKVFASLVDAFHAEAMQYLPDEVLKPFLSLPKEIWGKTGIKIKTSSLFALVSFLESMSSTGIAVAPEKGGGRLAMATMGNRVFINLWRMRNMLDDQLPELNEHLEELSFINDLLESVKGLKGEEALKKIYEGDSSNYKEKLDKIIDGYKEDCRVANEVLDAIGENNRHIITKFTELGSGDSSDDNYKEMINIFMHGLTDPIFGKRVGEMASELRGMQKEMGIDPLSLGGVLAIEEMICRGMRDLVTDPRHDAGYTQDYTQNETLSRMIDSLFAYNELLTGFPIDASIIVEAMRVANLKYENDRIVGWKSEKKSILRQIDDFRLALFRATIHYYRDNGIAIAIARWNKEVEIADMAKFQQFGDELVEQLGKVSEGVDNAMRQPRYFSTPAIGKRLGIFAGLEWLGTKTGAGQVTAGARFQAQTSLLVSKILDTTTWFQTAVAGGVTKQGEGIFNNGHALKESILKPELMLIKVLAPLRANPHMRGQFLNFCENTIDNWEKMSGADKQRCKNIITKMLEGDYYLTFADAWTEGEKKKIDPRRLWNRAREEELFESALDARKREVHHQEALLFFRLFNEFVVNEKVKSDQTNGNGVRNFLDRGFSSVWETMMEYHLVARRKEMTSLALILKLWLDPTNRQIKLREVRERQVRMVDEKMRRLVEVTKKAMNGGSNE